MQLASLELWRGRARRSAHRRAVQGAFCFCHSVAFSHDGLCILSRSEDNTLRLRDARPGAPSGELLKGHGITVTSLALSLDGSLIISASTDNTLRL